MTLDELTTLLRTSGVMLHRGGDTIRAVARPGETLSPEIVDGLRKHKVAILCQLVAEEAFEQVRHLTDLGAPTLETRADLGAIREAEGAAQEAHDRGEFAACKAAWERWAFAVRRVYVMPPARRVG